MKIAINRKVFLNDLEKVKDSIGKQTALPILKNVKLTAKEGALKFFTTNLSIGTIVSARDPSIFSEGEAVCDALKLLAVIKELPEKEIRMETDEKGHLIIECEKSHFRLFSMPPDEFPSEPGILEDQLLPINDQFFDSLRNVRYAASKEEGKYHLNCVYLDKEVVATDGHRMGVIRENLGFNNILIPLDFVNVMLKIGNRGDGNSFRVACSNNIIFLKSEYLILFGRLIDAEFPDYSQVIPNDSLRFVSVDRSKLSQAIKRIMLMSGKNYQMKFEFWPSSLILSSCTPDLGDATEELEIEYRSEMGEDKPFAIGLNGKYLLDMLETLAGERVNVAMGNEFSPIKVEEDGAVHILMPLRLVESEPKTESETEIEHDIEPESDSVEEAEME
jgi:DNA polymerase-3 subunit beta